MSELDLRIGSFRYDNTEALFVEELTSIPT